MEGRGGKGKGREGKGGEGKGRRGCPPQLQLLDPPLLVLGQRLMSGVCVLSSEHLLL